MTSVLIAILLFLPLAAVVAVIATLLGCLCSGIIVWILDL